MSEHTCTYVRYPSYIHIHTHTHTYTPTHPHAHTPLRANNNCPLYVHRCCWRTAVSTCRPSSRAASTTSSTTTARRPADRPSAPGPAPYSLSPARRTTCLSPRRSPPPTTANVARNSTGSATTSGTRDINPPALDPPSNAVQYLRWAV